MGDWLTQIKQIDRIICAYLRLLRELFLSPCYVMRSQAVGARMAIRPRGIVSRRNRGCKYVRTGREPGGASRRDLAVGKPVRAQPTVCDAPQHLASGQDANPPAAGSATAPRLALDGRFIRLSPRSRLHYVCRQREVIEVATARAVVCRQRLFHRAYCHKPSDCIEGPSEMANHA